MLKLFGYYRSAAFYNKFHKIWRNLQILFQITYIELHTLNSLINKLARLIE